MRPGQQKNRMRGRGRKGPNPLSRSYESNGPDVKIRGNAQHIAEKYSTLARDSAASGDRVIAENYLQHAEHYYRIVASAQPQGQQRESYDDNQDDDGDDDQDSGNSYQDDRNDNSERQNFDRQNSDRQNSDRQPQARNDRNERNDRGDRNDRGGREGNRERDGNRDRDTNRDRDASRSNSNNNGNRPDRDRNDRPERDRPERDRTDRDRTDRDRNERTENDRGERNDRDRNDRNERDRDGRREPIAADGTGPQPAIENGFVGAAREAERKRHDEPQVNGNGAEPSRDDAAGTGRNGEESDRPRRRGRTRRKRPDDGFGSAGGSDETSPQGEASAQVADVVTEQAVESSAPVSGAEEAPVKRKPGRPRKKKDDSAEKDVGGENDLPDFLLASNG